MTVGEILDILTDLPEDLEVRFAFQPSWPLEYEISDVVPVTTENGDEVVYIVQGEQIGYLDSNAAAELRWN